MMPKTMFILNLELLTALQVFFLTLRSPFPTNLMKIAVRTVKGSSVWVKAYTAKKFLIAPFKSGDAPLSYDPKRKMEKWIFTEAKLSCQCVMGPSDSSISASLVLDCTRPLSSKFRVWALYLALLERFRMISFSFPHCVKMSLEIQ